VSELAILTVEKNPDKHLVGPGTQAKAEIVAHRLRRGQRVTGRRLLGQGPARQLDYRAQYRSLRRPQARRSSDLRPRCRRQRRQTTVLSEEIARQIERTPPIASGAQQQR